MKPLTNSAAGYRMKKLLRNRTSADMGLSDNGGNDGVGCVFHINQAGPSNYIHSGSLYQKVSIILTSFPCCTMQNNDETVYKQRSREARVCTAEEQHMALPMV